MINSLWLMEWNCNINPINLLTMSDEDKKIVVDLLKKFVAIVILSTLICILLTLIFFPE